MVVNMNPVRFGPAWGWWRRRIRVVVRSSAMTRTPRQVFERDDRQLGRLASRTR
jgi:hypothetical protein